MSSTEKAHVSDHAVADPTGEYGRKYRVRQEMEKSMLWRAPWLRHRLELLTFAAWDVLSIYMSYNVVYLERIGRWEGLSTGLSAILATWLCVSYLIGRYSPPARIHSYPRLTKALKTAVAASSIIVIFVGHTWLYQIADAQTRFRGFLIPVVLSAFCLSTFGQIVRSALSTGRRSWILLVSESESQTMKKELEIEGHALQSRTEIVTNGQLSWPLARRDGSVGWGIGCINKYADEGRERILRLREEGETIVPLQNWCEQELQRIPPEIVQADWLIQAEGFGLRPGSISWRLKRFGDLLGAGILICITSPLVIVAGALIWLEDRGPVFYRQTRNGLYGRPFEIWKLRSMSVNAEHSGIQWSSKGDPRVTRVGKLTRSTRIDELPQLFGVLNGDLSLIGPRPERPEIEEKLGKVIPNYRLRHWIRPGLSGWAQVCYRYGASIEDSRTKLSYDLYYLRNAGLALDLLITLKTIRLVSGAKGASPLKSAGGARVD